MFTKRKLWGLLTVAVVLLGSGAAVASSLVNGLDPETRHGPAIVPPRLAPPSQTGYTSLAAGSKISAPDQRPVAQFPVPPSEVGEGVAVDFPTGQLQDPTKISYAVLASIQYTGNGHTVVVSTARASTAAANEPTVFGNQTIQLPDGTKAWATTGMPGATPNQLVFFRDDLIITVASNLPVDALRTLASQIIIQ